VTRSDGMLRLLLVDDSLTEADNVTNTLRSAGHAVRASRVDTLNGIEEALTQQTWDLLICRAGLSSVRPRELINFVNRLGRDIPCIVLTSGKDEIDTLYSLGLQDVIPAVDSKRLQFAVRRELENLFNRRSARRNERALRESEKRSRLLLETSKDAVAYMHEGMHIYVNSAYLELFGYEEAEDVDGLPILDLIAADDQSIFKSVFRQFSQQVDSEPVHVSVQGVREDGHVFKVDIEFSHAEVEGENCTQVVVRDEVVFEDVDSEQLKLLRDHDFLTGLYNRVRFMDEMEKVAGRAVDSQGDAALLYIVIDDFKVIKEKLGVAASELVLKELGEVLRKGIVEGDLLAHYADQVFTVIVNSDDDNYVDERAKNYWSIINNYVTSISDKPLDIKCSIGISRISETNSKVDTLLTQADKACVQAQKNSDNSIRRYQAAELELEGADFDEAASWKPRIEQAIEKQKFLLHYQPIVSLHGKEQQLYEVLLRMSDVESIELIAAKDFIKFATDLGMMGSIDHWIIPNALKSLAEHQQRFPKTRFFLKLSRQTICEPGVFDWLSGLLSEYGIAGESLIFEVSETDAMTNIAETKDILTKLKGVGCEFGLEHFGSGLNFSSSLDLLDVDYLKINGTFVENMAKDPENQAAVKAIIEICKNAGKHSIAEFVSDANSLALLWRLGVDYAQGYYIHEPSGELNYNFEDDDL
jgi:diguanylate cyclase (GGDEF)-like protein/PAS domain S-box-containing protein